MIFATLFLVITLSLAIITAHHRPNAQSITEINSMLMNTPPVAEKQQSPQQMLADKLQGAKKSKEDSSTTVMKNQKNKTL